MVLVIRVRGRGGMKRAMFSDENVTLQQLKVQIADLFSLSVDEIKLSMAPSGGSIISSPPSTSIKSLKISNGDIVYLQGERDDGSSAPSSSSSSLARSSSVRQLTPRCNHGPNAACPLCLGAQPGEVIKGGCNHGVNTTCIHCSQGVKEAAKEPATWLCNHPETAFCPLCLPPADPSQPQPSRCSCDKNKGQSCTRCLTIIPTVKVDKIPFARMMSEKKALCKFKHADSVSCVFCSPPDLPSFVGKKNCPKGHHPWPQGVCLSCAPANAIVKVQPYRHIDSVSIDAKIIQPFYVNWMRKGSALQRAAIIFGRYIPEPAETNNPGAIRAIAHALYEPPQDSMASGVKFNKDANEKMLHEVANWLGLEPIAWIVTTLPRSGEKYGGPVFMSAAEYSQASRFQSRYVDAFGYSRFATIVLEHASQVEPRAYQISDIGVALERDGCLGKSSDPYMLAAKAPEKGEMCATVVYKDRPLMPGQEFLPDELIVKVVLTSPKVSDCMFKHIDFPSIATDANIKSHLTQFAREEYIDRFSDFNLLCHLARVVGGALVKEVCSSIVARKPLPPTVKAKLDQALLEKKLI